MTEPLLRRKIKFQLTIGSHWPSDEGESNPWSVKLPVGGNFSDQVVEFETANQKPFEDACNALKKKMNGQDYHIWYWWWLS